MKPILTHPSGPQGSGSSKSVSFRPLSNPLLECQIGNFSPNSSLNISDERDEDNDSLDLNFGSTHSDVNSVPYGFDNQSVEMTPQVQQPQMVPPPSPLGTLQYYNPPPIKPLGVKPPGPVYQFDLGSVIQKNSDTQMPTASVSCPQDSTKSESIDNKHYTSIKSSSISLVSHKNDPKSQLQTSKPQEPPKQTDILPRKRKLKHLDASNVPQLPNDKTTDDSKQKEQNVNLKVKSSPTREKTKRKVEVSPRSQNTKSKVRRLTIDEVDGTKTSKSKETMPKMSKNSNLDKKSHEKAKDLRNVISKKKKEKFKKDTRIIKNRTPSPIDENLPECLKQDPDKLKSIQIWVSQCDNQEFSDENSEIGQHTTVSGPLSPDSGRLSVSCDHSVDGRKVVLGDTVDSGLSSLSNLTKSSYNCNFNGLVTNKTDFGIIGPPADNSNNIWRGKFHITISSKYNLSLINKADVISVNILRVSKPIYI